MRTHFEMEMLSKDKLEKGYHMIVVNEKGNTTKSITFQQEDILLWYLVGLTLDEISEEIGIEKSGVRDHLLRINRKIKFLLGEGEGLIRVTVPTKTVTHAVTWSMSADDIQTGARHWHPHREGTYTFNVLCTFDGEEWDITVTDAPLFPEHTTDEDDMLLKKFYYNTSVPLEYLYVYAYVMGAFRAELDKITITPII